MKNNVYNSYCNTAMKFTMLTVGKVGGGGESPPCLPASYAYIMYCIKSGPHTYLLEFNVTFLFPTGMAFIYFVVQFDYLGTMQAFFLLWSVKYPLKFRYMKCTGKMRYAHITGVLFILLGPLFGPLLVLADGYLISLTDSPYLAAFGRNRDHFFIAFTVPATISLAATTILMCFIFWTILQVCCVNYSFMHELAEPQSGHEN